MASPRTSTDNSGFTLIEIALVLGIFSLLALLPLFMDIGSYRGGAFRAQRDTLVVLLQKARADALTDVDREPHGLALFPPDHPTSYVLFEGASYSADPASHEAFEEGHGAALAQGAPAAVTFAELTADADYTGSIELIDPNRGTTASVDINQEGMISW